MFVVCVCVCLWMQRSFQWWSHGYHGHEISVTLKIRYLCARGSMVPFYGITIDIVLTVHNYNGFAIKSRALKRAQLSPDACSYLRTWHK